MHYPTRSVKYIFCANTANICNNACYVRFLSHSYGISKKKWFFIKHWSFYSTKVNSFSAQMLFLLHFSKLNVKKNILQTPKVAF